VLHQPRHRELGGGRVLRRVAGFFAAPAGEANSAGAAANVSIVSTATDVVRIRATEIPSIVRTGKLSGGYGIWDAG
jgi:hypothetical protein